MAWVVPGVGESSQRAWDFIWLTDVQLKTLARPAASICRARQLTVVQRSLVTKFSKDHEWVRVENGVATVGITDHAQEQLGDVVFVELPAVGNVVEQHGPMGAVESVKAASDVYAPVSGEVIEANQALNDEPGLINTAAESDGWMAKIKLVAPAEVDDLMDKDAYEKFCADN